MSKKKEKRPDRRTVLAIAAATAAMPSIASSADSAATPAPRQPTGAGTKVIVDLGGVLLPRAAAKEMEAEIRRSVLTAVAKAGFIAKISDQPIGPIGPPWVGLILRPQNVKNDPH